jgi:hypothetical protein
MKYCPECNREYSDAWLTFCTNDGSLLREQLTPPADPNWDPRIRGPQFDEPSEQATQWLPRDPTAPAPSVPDPSADVGWVVPGERTPVTHQWEPPPPPPQPTVKPAPPGLAIASFVIGIVGVMMGLVCAVPVPGILAVILGIIALVQLRGSQNSTGRGLAIAGIVMGGINLAFFVFGILWFLVSVSFG